MNFQKAFFDELLKIGARSRRTPSEIAQQKQMVAANNLPRIRAIRTVGGPPRTTADGIIGEQRMSRDVRIGRPAPIKKPIRIQNKPLPKLPTIPKKIANPGSPF